MKKQPSCQKAIASVYKMMMAQIDPTFRVWHFSTKIVRVAIDL